ncbi:MAG: DUF3108 domain-containing protein [Candidatus Omnitrophica bacterium]|nr:DUF3108 domain-containing protein [Candidatus Omnitrophota bacterium]
MKKFCVTLCVLVSGVLGGAYAQEIEDRFQGDDTISYRVYFNGIPVGKTEWTYIGTEDVRGVSAEVLEIQSDAKILHFLDLKGEERVYLHGETHLPVQVERDIVFFGRKERIREVYNQQEGVVKVHKQNSKEEKKTIRQQPPIHNILSLLYFFPDDTGLQKGETEVYRLPTQEVEINFHSQKVLKFHGEERDTYFLVGRGAKRFNLWLDQDLRLPLRLEFFIPFGKITIVKEKSDLNVSAAGNSAPRMNRFHLRRCADQGSIYSRQGIYTDKFLFQEKD